jgi:hypothetical protein
VALRASKLGIEAVLGAAVHFQSNRATFGQTQCGFKTFSQALAQTRCGCWSHLIASRHISN